MDTSSMPPVHKPTMGMTIVIVLGIFVLYHFTLGKK